MTLAPLSWHHHLSRVPPAAAREVVATLRSALWPLARLHRLPPVPAGAEAAVVLVHGYLGHPDMFRPLVRRLYEAGVGPVVCVRYPSTRLDLEAITERIGAAVQPLAARGPVDLVGHSLGAVACRAWLKLYGGDRLVRRFVSLGGPHAGTALYLFTPPRVRSALDPTGPWVRRLAQGPEPVPTTVIRSRYDQQVLPPVAASLPGIHEIVLDHCGHNGLLWDGRAHDAVVSVLTEP